MTTLFKTKIPSQLKIKEESRHPWEKRIKAEYSNVYKHGHNSAENPSFSKQKEKEETTQRSRIIVIGNRTNKEFIYCYYLVKGLHKYNKKQFEAPIIRGVTEVEWPEVLKDLKIQYGGKAYCLQSQVAVILDSKFLGGNEELKKFVESKYIYHLCLDYYNEGIKQLCSYISSSGRPCAYMHVSINGEEIGPLIFMLYADLVPRTCENFLRLCEAKKGGYSGTPVHRIVKDCWIQCGGFGLKDSPELECENFIVPHDRRGVLCMTNNGRHKECSTQFFVLLQPADWMEHKYVAFGQLIQGENTLTRIENVPTWYESPTQEILIYKAGIFNIECQYFPINKNTNEFLHSHVEDLFELGELLYQELLDRVFHQIELILLALEAVAEEGSEKESSTPSTASYVNNDYDVEVYEYEGEHYSYSKVSPPSLVVKPEKPYYLPLTDVPYPGEVKSTYDLKRFLRGDYCYEGDLQQDFKKKKTSDDFQRRLSIPEELLGALFECFEFTDYDRSSDSSFSPSDNALIEKYTSEHMDSVSFAGPIVKQMADMPRKYDVFDETKREAALQRLLTDDELRIIRVAKKEYNSARRKQVSICLSSSKLSHSRIIRRPTGFVRKEDLLKLGLDTETYESLEEELEIEDEEENEILSVAPKESKMHETVRPSVLTRLYDIFSEENIGKGPTLKEHRPHKLTSASEKSFALLTFSATFRFDHDSDKSLHQIPSDYKESIEYILQMQHGNRLYRKLSSDYVRTIDRLEHKAVQSIRSVEYSKKRPTMSVSQYKMENRKYQDILKPLQDVNFGKVSGKK